MPKREIGEIPGAPPALLLMLREFAIGADPEAIRRRIRAIIPDMREQSFAFEAQNVARLEPRSSHTFGIHPHGALDLLTGHGCMNLNCRIAASERLARSFGLIADQVWLTDLLSSEIIQMGRATNAKIEQLMGHAMVLAPLLPMIEAGIIRFRSPSIATCSGCAEHFESEVQATAREVLKVFRRDFRVERRDHGKYVVKTGKAFEPTMFFHGLSQDPNKPPSDREIAVYAVEREVREILWTAREASLTGGSIFTNSRVGLAGLLQREGRLPSRTCLKLFDVDRSLDIPWVSELSATQILQLREEAATALPALREKLARSLVLSGSESSETVGKELIAELRAQAAEVRAELGVSHLKSAKYWKTTFGVLSLAVSAYGVATDQIVPSLGGLLPIIQLLINHKAGHESEVAKIKTRPGFVLVKAQDILQHAH